VTQRRSSWDCVGAHAITIVCSRTASCRPQPVKHRPNEAAGMPPTPTEKPFNPGGALMPVPLAFH
jgi:hypothetical protein